LDASTVVWTSHYLLQSIINCVIVLFTRPQSKSPLLHLTYCDYRIRTSTHIHHFLGATSSETHDFHLSLVLLIIINTQTFFSSDLGHQSSNSTSQPISGQRRLSRMSINDITMSTNGNISTLDNLNILDSKIGRLTCHSGPSERRDPDIRCSHRDCRCHCPSTRHERW
jgi:hypothetical protein